MGEIVWSIVYGTVMILAALLLLGSERESGLWYSEHAKFWCNQKMPCWRRLVPHICEDPGILQFFVPFYINQYFILASFQFIINNVWQIHEVLQRATFDSNSQVGVIFHVMQAVESPPTYFRTNKLTNAFQEIIDAYGLVPLLSNRIVPRAWKTLII